MTVNRLRTLALGLVAVLALLVVGYRNPVAYLLMGTWLPLPLLVVGWRLGVGAAVLLAAAGGVLVYAAQPGGTVFLEHLGVVLLLLLGVTLSALRQRGWPAGTAILATVAGLSLAGAAAVLVLTLLQDMTLAAFWDLKSKELTQSLEGMFQQAGWGAGTLQVMGLPRQEWLHHLSLALPALMVINLGLVAWLNTLVVFQIAMALGWPSQEEPLSRWEAPQWLIFPFLAAGFAMLIPVPRVSLAAFNLFLILGFVYFGQGVAVLAAVLHRFRAPLLLRGVGYFLIFMNPLLMLLVMLLGLLDLWFDFRRLGKPQET